MAKKKKKAGEMIVPTPIELAKVNSLVGYTLGICPECQRHFIVCPWGFDNKIAYEKILTPAMERLFFNVPLSPAFKYLSWCKKHKSKGVCAFGVDEEEGD